jgi:hypothetical protein
MTSPWSPNVTASIHPSRHVAAAVNVVPTSMPSAYPLACNTRLRFRPRRRQLPTPAVLPVDEDEAVERVVTALAVVVVAVYARWAVGLEPFSGQATLAVVAVGGVAMVLGARRPRSEGAEPNASAGTVRWAVLGVVAAAWQLAAYVQHPRDDHPTVSSLANALLGTLAARTVALVLWIAGARALARR